MSVTTIVSNRVIRMENFGFLLQEVPVFLDYNTKLMLFIYELVYVTTIRKEIIEF